MASAPTLQKHNPLPFILLVAMACAILFLDAVLPLSGFWFHTALLPQLGSWPLLPTHLLFPGWAISSAITSLQPTPPPISLSWEQVPLLLIASLIIFLLYLLALRRLPRYITSYRFIFYSTLLLGLLYALIPVVTSGDIFSYITYARMGIIYHLNPLTTLPTAIRTDPTYPHLYWNNQPSAYGPTWIAISSLLQWLTLPFGSQSLLPMIIALRLFGLAAHLCSTRLIWSIAWRIQSLQGHISPQKRIQATLAFAWNPLLLLEACLNAHNDAALLLFVLLAIWFLVPKPNKQPTSRPYVSYLLAITMLAVATCLKLNVILLVPIFLIFIWKQIMEPSATRSRALGQAGTSRGKARTSRRQGGDKPRPYYGTREPSAKPDHSRGDGLSSPWGGAAAYGATWEAATSLIYVAIIILLYAPFWQNGALLNVLHTNPTASRNINTLAEFISRLCNSIISDLGYPLPPLNGSPAEAFTHTLSIAIFVILYALLCWRAIRTARTLNTLPSLMRWLAGIWLLYCAIGTPWSWPWYTVTFFGLYALVGATSTDEITVFGLRGVPLATSLLAFSMFSIYCFYAWGPHSSFIPGLPAFQWAYLRGLWVWGIPLLLLHPNIRQMYHVQPNKNKDVDIIKAYRHRSQNRKQNQ